MDLGVDLDVCMTAALSFLSVDRVFAASVYFDGDMQWLEKFLPIVFYFWRFGRSGAGLGY